MSEQTAREKGPFISLGSSKSIAITSLDDYIQYAKANQLLVNVPIPSIAADPADLIASLQQEESKICEELNTERRRSDGLKQTYYRALSLASAQNREKLFAIAKILSSCDQKDQTISQVMDIIRNSDAKEAEFVPNTARATDLNQKAMKSDSANNELKTENASIKEKIQSVSEEIEVLKAQLSDQTSKVEAVTSKRKELKEKLKTLAATFKKKDAAYKEKIAALEAQIEGRKH